MNVATRALTSMSVCTATGYLDVGLELGLGVKIVPCLLCEGEAYAASLLAKRMEEGTVPQSAIWSDLNTLTSTEVSDYMGRFLRGRTLDIFVGGIPCQPWSVAGNRGGISDARDLWPGSLKAISFYQPGIVLLENVPGFLAPGGLDRVAADLEGLGYRVAAGLFSAKETGAHHKRDRLFILGISESYHERWQRQRQSHGSIAAGGSSGDGLADASRNVGDGHLGTQSRQGLGQPNGQRFEEFPDSIARKSRDTERFGSGLEFSDGSRRAQTGSGYSLDSGSEPEQGCGIVWAGNALYAPGRNAYGEWREVLAGRPHLSPALTDEEAESILRGVPNGLVSWNNERVDRLRACGNGVVPLSAAVAVLSLYSCLQFGES